MRRNGNNDNNRRNVNCNNDPNNRHEMTQKIQIKVLYMNYKQTENIKEMLTNAEVDDAIQNDYENIRKYLPCRTSTHITYNAGSTEAFIWNEGEKKKTKIFLPHEDGWYLTDSKYGIPNGEKSSNSNPNARYLWRWQNKDYDGLLVRGFGYDDYVRRFVYCYLGPYVRLGVSYDGEKPKTKKQVDNTNWKLKYENLLAKLKETVEDEGR